VTFLAALRHDRIDAPWFIEGPIDSASFQAYVEKVLLPTLRPGDIIVTDNLGSHKSKVVCQLTRSAGAKLLFMPKYSPDLNPFERIFAKLEHLLQTAPPEYGLHSRRSAPRHLHTRSMRQLPQKHRLSSYCHHALVGGEPRYLSHMDPPAGNVPFRGCNSTLTALVRDHLAIVRQRACANQFDIAAELRHRA
jgi:transposase